MKYHKLFSTVLSATLLFSVADTMAVPVHIYADTASEIITTGDMSFTVSNKNADELILTAYNGTDTSLIVPEKVNDKTVTAIDDKVFFGISGLETVILPDSINYFGADVFRDSSVKSVNIPKSLKVIPSYTFNNCQELENVAFHDSIAILANTAFKKTNITVPDNLRSRVTGSIIYTSESSCSFSTDEWDYNVSCQNGMIHLDFTKYKGTEKDITMPDAINYYDEISCNKNIFVNVSKIRKVVFPEKMSTLAVSFADTTLEEVVLPTDCNIIPSMFENCSKLTSVTFGGNTTSLTIGANAFRNCTSLENISFLEKCKQLRIGKYAFENTGISELILNCSSDIGSRAFSNCSSLLSAELTDAKVSDRAFMDCTSLKEMTFHGEVVLDDYSIYDCPNLENINFTDCKLTSYNAFRGCPKLYTINSETVFSKENGDFIPKYKDFIFTHFNGSDNVGFINDYVSAQVRRIVRENTNDDMTDMEKVIALHDWVCSNTKYTEGSISERENHCDVSIFMNEYTVCEGYARACNLLYHEAGLESWYVNSSDHAWNIVNVEGNYFHVDTTWDDIDGTSRKWFMKSDEEFRKEGGSHAEWELYVPSPLHEFQGDVLPECKYRMGDVNADGVINTADLVALQKYLHGRSTLGKEHWVLSDVCYDGKVDVFDIISLRRIVIGELS